MNDRISKSRRGTRRVIYLSRVDHDGHSDALKTGADALEVGTFAEGSGVTAPQREETRSETPQERWLRENVPPHW